MKNTQTFAEVPQERVDKIVEKQKKKKYYFVKWKDEETKRKLGKRFKHISKARQFALDKMQKKSLIMFTNQNRTRLTL